MTESNEELIDENVGVASRRALLLGAGALGAAGLLAACGNNAEPGAASAPARTPPPPATTISPGAAPTTTGPDADGIRVADIPVGSGAIFSDKKVVVTQPTAGTFKAFDATCTHQGCLVTGIQGGKITCPCHGSQFNIADGSVAQGPAIQPLPAKTATVNGATITVT